MFPRGEGATCYEEKSVRNPTPIEDDGNHVGFSSDSRTYPMPIKDPTSSLDFRS